MSGVDFQNVESSVFGALGGCHEGTRQLLNFFERQRPRGGVALKGHCTRRHGLPAPVPLVGHVTVPGAQGRGLSSGVCELDADERALRVDKRRHSTPRRNLVVVPQTRAPDRNTPLRDHRRRLRHYQTGSASG